jgi:LacI family transcriptional regulator
MARPTIKDLAQAAGVSVATVNRVLAGADNVRQPTRLLVQKAAETIGFYGLGAIQSHVAAHRPKLRLGVLLLQPYRSFYQMLAAELRELAAAETEAEIEMRIEFLEDLTPQHTAARILALAETCQAIALTSAVHPDVTRALDSVRARGIPVFAYISQLSASGEMPYVGLDNWKVGRTCAWGIDHLCRPGGKVGLLMGNPRFRSQEMNEAGFRSYFRENASRVTILEPQLTFESAAIAEEISETLLRDPDLTGIYVAGGGISGAIAALQSSPRRSEVVLIGYQLMDVTRAALLDGTMTLVIASPIRQMTEALLAGMIRAVTGQGGNLTTILPFEIITRENL